MSMHAIIEVEAVVRYLDDASNKDEVIEACGGDWMIHGLYGTLHYSGSDGHTHRLVAPGQMLVKFKGGRLQAFSPEEVRAFWVDPDETPQSRMMVASESHDAPKPAADNGFVLPTSTWVG